MAVSDETLSQGFFCPNTFSHCCQAARALSPVSRQARRSNSCSLLGQQVAVERKLRTVKDSRLAFELKGPPKGFFVTRMKQTTWLHYIKLYRQFYFTLIICAVASAGQSFILLAIVLLIRRAFDEAIPAKNFSLLVVIGTSIFLANVASEAIIVITEISDSQDHQARYTTTPA